MLSQRAESLLEHLVSAIYSLLYSRWEVYPWILVSLSKKKTPQNTSSFDFFFKD